mmetsp:Transcript_53108/g.94771  ORF Transcript_53108/g.94771 Transcript_53108/m.94771 type:complete len:86 (-) Transcript_53108:1213-1470(-)
MDNYTTSIQSIHIPRNQYCNLSVDVFHYNDLALQQHPLLSVEVSYPLTCHSALILPKPMQAWITPTMLVPDDDKKKPRAQGKGTG